MVKQKIIVITILLLTFVQLKGQLFRDNIKNITEDNADRYFVKQAFSMIAKEKRNMTDMDYALLYFLYATSPICYYDTLEVEIPKIEEHLAIDYKRENTIVTWKYANKAYMMTISWQFKRIGSEEILFKGYELTIIEDKEKYTLEKQIFFFAIDHGRYQDYSFLNYDLIFFKKITMDDRRSLCGIRRNFSGYNKTLINYKDKKTPARDFNIEIREDIKYGSSGFSWLYWSLDSRILGDSVEATKYLLKNKIWYESNVSGFIGEPRLFDGTGYFNKKYEDVEEYTYYYREPFAY